MSSLIVSNDLEIMMLEFAVQKLYVPKSSVFDSVIMKKTTVMFRMLDDDWTTLNPHRGDWVAYRGSNLEEEDFHGGKSVVFAIPTERLEDKVNGVDVQIHVRKEVSKYFEMEPCQNVGTALINVDDLFNGIIKELKEREELEGYLSGFHKRQPISRSLKGTYEIIDDNQLKNGASITVYVRLSHFGKSIITEIEAVPGKRGDFYAQEETNESYPYQCRELKTSKLEGGCWGSETLLPPLKPDQLTCHCDIWDPSCESFDESYDSDEETRKGEWENYERPALSDYDVDDGRDDGKRRSTRGKGSKDKKHSSGDKTRVTNEKTRPSHDRQERRDTTSHGSLTERTSKKKVGGKRGKKKSTKNGTKKKRNIYKSDGVRDSTEMTEDPDERREKIAEDEDDSEIDRSSEKTLKIPKGKNIKIKRKARDRTSQMEDDQNEFKKKRKKKKSVAGIVKKEGRAVRLGAADTKVAEKTEKSSRRAFDSTEPSDHGEHPKMKDTPVERTGDKASEEKLDDKGREASAIKPRATPSDEYRNRRLRLRRRQRGVVTVGFQDKEKKICHEALETPSTLPATLPPVSPMSSSIQPTICPSLHSPSYCCYPSIPECKLAMFSPFSCSVDTSRTDPPCRFFERPNSVIVPDLAVFTN